MLLYLFRNLGVQETELVLSKIRLLSVNDQEEHFLELAIEKLKFKQNVVLCLYSLNFGCSDVLPRSCLATITGASKIERAEFPSYLEVRASRAEYPRSLHAQRQMLHLGFPQDGTGLPR